jgi:tetratricopeptide (TPR) repeat protein
VDNLLSLGGRGDTPESVADGRIADWDEIAAMNYASPYPWFFEGLVCHAQNKMEEADACYENALVNPAFDAECGKALMVLGAMPSDELEALKEKLEGLEDEIFAAYTPEPTDVPRDVRCFDDVYLCLRAREALEANETDYRGALRYYEAALKVNPFEGDNFAGCALLCLYLNDIDRTFFYVNEGLYVDPEHEGLNRLADMLNEEGAK